MISQPFSFATVRPVCLSIFPSQESSFMEVCYTKDVIGA